MQHLFDHIVNNIVIRHYYNIKSIFDIVDNIFCYCLQFFLDYYNFNSNNINNIIYTVHNIVCKQYCLFILFVNNIVYIVVNNIVVNNIVVNNIVKKIVVNNNVTILFTI